MKRNRGLALLLALCLLAGMAVLPVAAQDEPGTLPVCLPGDVMDDEMGYADINGVPWGTGWKTSRVTAPAEWTGEIWPDSTEPKVGGVEVKDGNIRISRTGEITDSNTAAVTRVLSSQTQPDDNMTLEFEYEKEETAKLYMSISAATNWRGPLALVHNPNGSFSSAGQGGGTLNNINATGTVKVTMHLHILREDPEEADKETGGYATIYINDQLLVENYQYDPRYVGYYEPGNIGFTLQKGTEMNQGVTIHYVRYTETEQYAEIAMAKDAQSIDCQGLPQSGSAITESLTLPEIPENLPYGSAAVWNSSDDNILNAQTGEVVRGERDQTVTLSLNMSKLDENGEIATETTPTVSFQYTVTGTAAESDVPGTLPVRLPGDVMDDEMGYADINDVPWGYWKNGYPGGIADQTEGKPLPYLHMYVTGAVAQPADFSGEAWYDDENRSSKDGAIEVVNGNLKLTRTAAQNTGQTVSLAKFLALDAQTVDKMTIELEYEKDPGAKLQIGLQAWNNWKGAFAFTHNEEGAFEGVNGSTGITSTGITKMTLHLDKAEKTVDIYINDRLLKKGMAYDSRYLDFCDAGKIGFNLLNAGEPNKGVTIHAIRYMETAQYANIALAKDKAALDADALRAFRRINLCWKKI